MWQSHTRINSNSNIIKKYHKCTEKRTEQDYVSQRWVPNQLTPQPPKQISNPFLPFLKPNFPQAPNPLEHQLYRGEAREFAN